MAINGTGIQFELGDVITKVDMLKARLEPALLMVTNTMALKMERWAKQNAKWSDITGNARDTLSGRAYKEAGMIVAEISHGVEYGIWLELAHQQKYAILEDSLEANKDMIMEAWAKVVSKQ